MENAIVINDNIQKSKIDIKLIVSAAILFLMVFFRDLRLFTFPPLYFFIVVSLISILLPYKSLKSFFYYYITVGVAIHGVALIPILLALIIKNHKFNIYQIIFPAIILVFELLHLAGYSSSIDFNKYIVYALYISLFFFLLFDDDDNNNVVMREIKYYIVGTMASSFIILFHSIINFGFSEVALGSFRMGSSFEDYDIGAQMVTSMNPNQLAFYTLTAISLILFVKDVFQFKISKYIILLFLIFIGILSASRTWLILLAIVLVMYFLLSNMKGRFSFVLIVGVLLFTAIKFLDYSDVVYSRYENRFEDVSFGTAGHRLEILKEYNLWLINNPERLVYGAGVLCYNQVANLEFSTHNSIQQIIVCYGVIGLLIFLFCIYIYHNRYTRRNNLHLWIFVPIIACFLFSQSGQFLSPAYMMFPFVATALPLKLSIKN